MPAANTTPRTAPLVPRRAPPVNHVHLGKEAGREWAENASWDELDAAKQAVIGGSSAFRAAFWTGVEAVIESLDVPVELAKRRPADVQSD